jgi:glycosyltransferase involved in cell wall biosynthesis
MKILLVHKYFWHKFGGAEVFFLETGRVLEENGHSVAYFSTLEENNLPTPYSKYFSKPVDYDAPGVFKKIKAFLKVPYNFEAKRKFEQLVNDFRPDIIHVFNIMTNISPSILDVARKKGIPVVISCNDYKHICPNYKLFHHGKICEECRGYKFYRAVKNRCCKYSLSGSAASAVEAYIHKWLNVYRKNIRLYLFSSNFMARKTEEFWGAGSFRWDKLMNPLKIPELVRTAEAGEYGLYFGRIIDEKGIYVLIEALKHCPQIPFKIVGNGPDMEKLQAEAARNNLNNVEFTGAIWGEKLDGIIARSRFVVVPSIWYENFPYVILQSFAQAKPVIATNRGGIPEIVTEHENGLLYDAQNPAELSEKIKMLYADAELSAQMGIKARTYVENTFSDTAFYEKLLSIYNNILQ